MTKRLYRRRAIEAPLKIVPDDFLSRKITDVTFSEKPQLNTKVQNALVKVLKSLGYTTIEGLITCSEAKIGGIQNFGKECIAAVKNTLAANGLSLAPDDPGPMPPGPDSAP